MSIPTITTLLSYFKNNKTQKIQVEEKNVNRLLPVYYYNKIYLTTKCPDFNKKWNYTLFSDNYGMHYIAI